MSIDCVYSMDQENPYIDVPLVSYALQSRDVERRARHIVRSVVQDNLKPLLNSNEESPCKRWLGFTMNLKLQDNNSVLDQQILNYLQTGVDPKLEDCNESFKGVRDALMEEGIVLDEGNRLKLLTPQEQHAEVIKAARPIVLNIVYKNIKKCISSSKGNDSINSNFLLYYDKITSELYREQLDNDIVNYLINGQDPKYFSCPSSFKGIREELKKSEIVLNKQTNTLRFLTNKEKRGIEEEYKKMILDFVEI